MGNKKGDIAIEKILILVLVLATALIIAVLLFGLWGPEGKLPDLFSKVLSVKTPW